MTIVFAFLSVVLFVVGISFLFKSYRDIPAGGKIAAGEDGERLKKELAGTREESQQLKQQLDTIAVELDETRQKLQEAEQKGQEHDGLKAKESESQEKIRQLQHDLNFLYSKADQQAARAVGVLEELGQEKGRLREEMAALEQKIAEAPAENLAAEKEKLEGDLQTNQAKIQSLEAERDQLQETLQQAQAQARTADQRQSEDRQALTAGIKKIRDRVKTIESEFFGLLQAKEEQRRQARAEAERLNETLAALKDEQAKNVQKIEDMQAQAVPSGSEASESRPAESAAGNDELRRLKEQNDLLAEKESMLMFELTKSRAKVMGLEKLCRDMRKQQEAQARGRS